MKKEEMTGYPHIDKPWMKYYDESQRKSYIPNSNMTQYIKDLNKNNGSLIAETYYGNKITYDELFYKSDLVAKALSQLGVKKGDIIMKLMPNVPEAAQGWLGATEIGAISDFIDPRPDSMDINANAKKVLELVKYEKAKYILALDVCYLSMLKPIENELKELGIESIITVSSQDSMTIDGKIDYLNDVVAYNDLKNARNPKEQLESYKAILNKIKTMEEMSLAYEVSIKNSPLKVVKLKDLMYECQNSQIYRVNDSDLVNYIGHTSGTSGARPKPITITNANCISSVDQTIRAKVAPKTGENVLHILPFFAPFGAFNNFLLNLGVGANNIDVPEFEINEFGYLIKKYKPNAIMTTPAWLAALPSYKYLDNEDLSYITKIIYGGDSMTPEDEEKLNEWLKQHGSSAKIEKGHGMSEYCGCGSYARGEYNKYGAIGIPIPDTIYTIVDPNIDDKLVPLKFDKNSDRLAGELIVSGGAVTNGILHNDIVVPHFDLDGKSYIRTRDLVEMDRDGVFFHNARKDRSFARFDGYKIKPHEIEKKIEENKYVKYAKLVGYFDENKRGIMPICHIVLEEEYKDISQIDIVSDIVNNTIIADPTMSSRQIPSKFKIREFMPLTKNSKVNFNALIAEGLTGDEISVNVEETNLNVEKIEIYKNCKTLELK